MAADVLGALVCAELAVIGFRGRLPLFVHPRYVPFTVLMAAVGCVVLAASAGRRAMSRPTANRHATGHGHADTHEHTGFHGRAARRRNVARARSGESFLKRLVRAGGVALVLVTVGVLGVAPTGSLASYTANQRSQDTYVDRDGIRQARWFHAPQSLYEYSQVLKVEEGARRLIGQPVTVTGFVWDDPDTGPDTMAVSRMIISCCAMDALPNSLPVQLPGWRQRHRVDSWVRVEGTFVVGPAGTGVVVRPSTVTPISEPDEPYDYLTF